MIKWLLIIFIGLIVLASLSPRPEPEAKGPPTVEDIEWQSTVLSMRMIRESLKDPNSFELRQAIRLPDKTVCVVYMGTNSFNAKITDYAVILKDSIALGSDSYRKHCGGKVGDDISHIRHAI